MDVQRRWLDLFAEALRQAVAAGELPADADVDQAVYEVTAMLVRANFTWIVTGDVTTLDQARAGIEHVLDRIAGPVERKGRAAGARTRDRSRA
jgi:hypothetical protein